MTRTLCTRLSLAFLVILLAFGCGGEEPPAPEGAGEEAPAEAAPEEAAPEPEGAGEAAPERPAGEPSEAARGIQVRIGAIIPLTGLTPSYGEEAENAIDLARQDALRRGEVAPQIEIIDNGGTQQKTATAVNRLTDALKVDVIVGPLVSNNTIAAGELVEAAGVPLVSPSATNEEVTRDKRYVFRTCFTDGFQGAAAADFAYDKLAARRAAVLVSSSQAYSMALGESFAEAFKRRGGEIVSHMSFTSDTDDFGGQISQLRLKRPDVIFLPAYYEAAAKCVSQARVAGLRATFVGSDGWDSPRLYEISGGEVEDNYFTAHFSPQEDRAVVKRFVQNYSAKYDERPGSIAALTYDATMLVLDAVKRAGSTERDAIRDALEATRDFEGVTGRFSIDENHNAVKRLVVLKTGKDAPTLEAIVTP